MEDTLQKVSNDHRTIYYSSQIKAMDISQNIRAMGAKITDNEIKTVTVETFNHFCMLEKIFQEASLPHIYQLIKTINQNYNSIIAILLDKQAKFAQIISAKNANNEKQEEGLDNKVEEGIPSMTNLLRQIKKNKLGGIHLFNENYARYLEDHRILDQIKMEKGKRIHRNRLEILRESIFEELNHKTDVEEFPAKNDEITNYILKSKDKNSIFNYISYEPQLQEILAFFQNSQSQANDFLVRKVGKINQEEGTFSFSEFQREIQLKNFNFKKLIVEKFKQFIEKYKKKEAEMEKYVNEKETFFKKLQQKYFRMQEISTQTDLNLDEYLRNHEQKLKQIQLKCQALENMKKQQMNNNEKEGELLNQLAIRQSHIDKLHSKLSELQAALEYVKKLLRQEKTKKSYSIKQESQKTQKTILEISQKQKQKSIKQSNQNTEAVNEEILNLNSSQQIRKSSYMSNSWRRKQSNDGMSYMSFNELEKDTKDHDSVLKMDKKKYVRYNVESKFTQSDKSDAYYTKPKPLQSAQTSVQTDFRPEDFYFREQNKNHHTEQYQNEKGSSKKAKVTPSSTPKISSKNVDFNINKTSSERLTETSKKLKQRNNITSLTKIKSLQESSHNENEIKRNSKSKQKKKSKRETIKIVKQQHQQKKQEIKLDKLHFSKQPLQQIGVIDQKQQVKPHTQLPQPPSKIIEKKDQLAYKIFEVVEEEEEQKETIKNTERSEKMPSIYSHKKLEFDLIDKLNKQLCRIKTEKQCTYEHLYNITILPQQKHFQMKKYDLKTAHHSDLKIDQRNSIDINEPTLEINDLMKVKSKPELEVNDLLKIKSKDQPKPIAIFDDLIKSTASENQIKKEKLKNWKKKLINHIRLETISQKEAEQIVCIISESAKIKQSLFEYENVVSPISSISSNIRNSLPEIEENCEGRPLKKLAGCLRKAKLKTSCEQSMETNARVDKVEDKMTPQYQQKLEELIHYEVFQPHFQQKFSLLHKKCREGAICSHINKYFESIMKYYEQKKKKGKQTLVLPIEHIGNRTEVQQNLEKENKQSPKKIENTSNKDCQSQKEVNTSKGKNIVLTRQRLSQELTLPNIKDFKILQSKTSKIVN